MMRLRSAGRSVATITVVSLLRVVLIVTAVNSLFTPTQPSSAATTTGRWKPFTALQSALQQQEECPSGYFLDTLHARCSRLGPLGRASQVIETSFGPFKKASTAISNLFGVDKTRIASLGVAFALSYSIISNINGAISLSMAWYMTCTRTGLSPLSHGQWKELLKSYGTIYALIQLLRPFRVAAAIAMSKLSKEFLEETQTRLNCSRGKAILVQYLLGQMMLAACAAFGVMVASWLSGVPVWAGY